MKIVVVGGTGRIGSRVVANLGGEGHETIPASPNTGVDTLTGEGLREVLRNCDVVIDASDSPSFEEAAVMSFFRTSTGNLLTAAKAAGVGHHVALSVVGVERMADKGYFKAKSVQEQLIVDSGLPYSIVHATQFFEFAEKIAALATHGDEVRLPPVRFQPMAAEEVAAVVARTAVGEPVNGIVEIAGPETLRLDEFVRQVLDSRGDPRHVVPDPAALYIGAYQLDDGTLLPGDGAMLAQIHFRDWLERQLLTSNAMPVPAIVAAPKEAQ